MSDDLKLGQLRFDGDIVCFIGADGREDSIATLFRPYFHDDEEQNEKIEKAYGNLFAAAPDLLEALNRFDVEGLELEGDEEIDITMTAEDLRILRAAIAKAKGGSP